MELIVIGAMAVTAALLIGFSLGRRVGPQTLESAVKRIESADRSVALRELGWLATDATTSEDTDERWQPTSEIKARKQAVPQDRWISVGEIFSPAAPVHRRDLFAGRRRQMETLVDVAFERGQHAAVFGERGVGKTSLATIMTSVFSTLGNKLSLKVNCDATDDFDSVWRKVMDEMRVVATLSKDGQSRPSKVVLEIAIEDLQAVGTIRPSHVSRFLRVISEERECIIFLDEFERLEDATTTGSFAETIKLLSDQTVAATIVLVGVADNLEELLSEHSSIERALAQIRMPRMSRDELSDIVDRGLLMLDMKIDHAAKDTIVSISCGLPHFTHLIAQAAARTAVDQQETEISLEHVIDAITRLSYRTQETVQNAYSLAISSKRETIYSEVLLACCLAPADPLGFFSASDVVEPLTAVMGRHCPISSFSRNLHALAEPSRGPALQKRGGEHRHRFRFMNTLLQPYALMKGLAEGRIDEGHLERFLGESARAS